MMPLSIPGALKRGVGGQVRERLFDARRLAPTRDEHGESADQRQHNAEGGQPLNGSQQQLLVVVGRNRFHRKRLAKFSAVWTADTSAPSCFKVSVAPCM